MGATILAAWPWSLPCPQNNAPPAERHGKVEFLHARAARARTPDSVFPMIDAATSIIGEPAAMAGKRLEVAPARWNAREQYY